MLAAPPTSGDCPPESESPVAPITYALDAASYMNGIVVKYTRDGASKSVKVDMATIIALDTLRMIGSDAIALKEAILLDPELKKHFADHPDVVSKLAAHLAKPAEGPVTPMVTTQKTIEAFLSKSDTWPRPR